MPLSSDNLLVVAQCVDCGRWSQQPDREMNITVTISKNGLAGIFARCVNQLLCAENRRA